MPSGGSESPVERVEAGLRVDVLPGDALPSVRALAEQYGISTATVVKAMRRLREAGLIVSRSGWGVSRPDHYHF